VSTLTSYVPPNGLGAQLRGPSQASAEVPGFAASEATTFGASRRPGRLAAPCCAGSALRHRYDSPMMKSGPGRCVSAATCVAMLLATACAHRYSENREDWVGPRERDFEADFAICRARMDEAPFRYGGDPRLIFLDCMEKRGWYLKGRSWLPALA
jgi:hypothetical protein